LRAPGSGACTSTPRAAWRAWRPETGLGPRTQRLDRDLGEGEEQQAAAVRGHMALLAELLSLHGGRLDVMLRQDAAEAQVRGAPAWGIGKGRLGAQLLALHGGRLDAMLRQDAAEAHVRAATARARARRAGRPRQDPGRGGARATPRPRA